MENQLVASHPPAEIEQLSLLRNELRGATRLGHLPLTESTRRLLRTCLVLAVSLLFFIILAYRLDIAPDIHMDEIIYYRAGYMLATTGEFTWDIDPIFVHPPVQFLTQAVFLRLIGLTAEFQPFAGTYSARLVNALAAAITAVMLFRLVERLGGLRAAMLASAILALDPYVVRINRRNMLETLAELWIVAGLYFFWRERDRLNGRSILLIGLIFGLGLLTKELVIFGYGSLLVFTALAGRWADIKKVLAIGGVAFWVWTLFPFWAWSVGQWPVFVDNKTYNLRRLLGLVQITGWNRPGVSFVGALEVNLPQYATSYALVLGGVVAVTLLVFTWRDERGRFVLAWAGTMYAFFAYSVAGGALNDQFFYFLIVPVVTLLGTLLARWLDLLTGAPNPATPAPGLLILTGPGSIPLLPYSLKKTLQFIDDRLLVISGWLGRLGGWLSARRWLATGLLWITIALFMTMLAFNSYRWITLFALESDNSLHQLAGYIEANIPPGTKINSMFEDSEPTLHLMLPDYRMVTLRDPAAIEAHGVEYAILSSKNLWGAFGLITPDYYDWVQANGTPIFTTYGNTYWDVTLYRLHLGKEQ